MSQVDTWQLPAISVRTNPHTYSLLVDFMRVLHLSPPLKHRLYAIECHFIHLLLIDVSITLIIFVRMMSNGIIFIHYSSPSQKL